MTQVRQYSTRKRKGKDNDTVDDNDDERRYGEKAYWDKRYDKIQPKKHETVNNNDDEKALSPSSSSSSIDETSEWLLSYTELEPLLIPKLRRGPQSSVLDVGCGISHFLVDMCEKGKHTGPLVGIDISGIDAAKEMNKNHKNITILNIDARCCSKEFNVCEFDAILDKSTIDGMLCDEVNGLEHVIQMTNNIGMILKEGGVYCIVSHNNPQVDDDSEIVVTEWLEAVIKGLLSDGRRTFRLDIHFFSNDEQQQSSSSPSVYLFTRTRRSGRLKNEDEDALAIEMELHEH